MTERFGFVETNVPAFEDVYAGKLHGPRNRQYPRDLFDLKLFYDNEGADRLNRSARSWSTLRAPALRSTSFSRRAAPVRA